MAPPRKQPRPQLTTARRQLTLAVREAEATAGGDSDLSEGEALRSLIQAAYKVLQEEDSTRPDDAEILEAAAAIIYKHAHPSRLGQVPTPEMQQWLAGTPEMLRWMALRARKGSMG